MGLLDRIKATGTLDPATCELSIIPGIDYGRVPIMDMDHHQLISFGRATVRCPSCHDNRALVLYCPDEDIARLDGRCLRGCTPEAIGAAMQKWIADCERQTLIESWSIDRLATRGAVAADPIVAGYIYRRNLTMVYGVRGARKTMSLIARAICVAAGIPWLGCSVQQGLAVLVLQEGDRAQLDQWIGRIALGLGVDRQSLREGLLVYPDDLRVDVDASWEAFRSQVMPLSPAYVGLDNLTRLRARATGNAATDPAINAAIMDRVEKLARGGPGVELLNHSNAHGDPFGSQVPGNVCDLEFRISAGGADNDSVVAMALGQKQRVGTARPVIRYRFRDRDDGAIVPELVETPAVAAVAELTGDDLRRQQMIELPGLAGGMAAGAIYEAMDSLHDCGRNTTKRVRDALEAKGLLVKEGNLWRRA